MENKLTRFITALCLLPTLAGAAGFQYCPDGQGVWLDNTGVWSCVARATPVPPTPANTAVATATAVNTPMPTATALHTATQLTATYAPASLAAKTTRCDSVTVTGVIAGKTIVANPGVSAVTGCVISSVRASATNTVEVCWMNTIDTTTACQMGSSTWVFTQMP